MCFCLNLALDRFAVLGTVRRKYVSDLKFWYNGWLKRGKKFT